MFAHSSQITGIVEKPRVKPIEHRRIVGGLRERIIYMPGSQMMQSPIPESKKFYIPVVDSQDQRKERNSDVQAMASKICNKIDNMIYDQETKLASTIEDMQDQIIKIQNVQEEIEIRLITLQQELRMRSFRNSSNTCKSTQGASRPRSLVH